MIADMEGDKTILYTLTLPPFLYLVFIHRNFLVSDLLDHQSAPVSTRKISPFFQLHLSKISLWKFPLIFILSNLFFGFFALWISSVLKKMSSISHLFVARVINPMYMFRGLSLFLDRRL